MGPAPEDTAYAVYVSIKQLVFIKYSEINFIRDNNDICYFILFM